VTEAIDIVCDLSEKELIQERVRDRGILDALVALLTHYSYEIRKSAADTISVIASALEEQSAAIMLPTRVLY
jgi:hypothetical protein